MYSGLHQTSILYILQRAQKMEKKLKIGKNKLLKMKNGVKTEN